MADPSRLRPRLWLSRRVECWLTVTALTTWAGHVLLETALLPRDASSPGRWALPVAATGSIVAFGAAHDRLRPWVRSAMHLVAGTLAANGAVHLANMLAGSGLAREMFGLMTLLGGLVLLALAVLTPILLRGERERRGRWVRRAAAGLTFVVAVPMLLVPLVVAQVQTHRLHSVAEPPNAAYSEVLLQTDDGVELSGWYRPSSNGAAVVLVPTASGARSSVIDHAKILAAHGYGVLVYDSRGSGLSTGPRNGYGWGWDRDVRAAVSYLRARDDVDPAKIGAFGLSTGADVLLEVMSDPGSGIAASVLDGATARSAAGLEPLGGWDSLWFEVLFGAMTALSGTRPGPPLPALASRAAGAPLLMIAAGSIPQEIPLNELYAERSGAELWSLPHVEHIDGIHEMGAAYERRIVGFFDAYLLSP